VRRIRAAVALAALIVAALGARSHVDAAEAAPAAACSSSSGVTVVVDFGSLGGGTQVRCATGSPSSGLDALSKAGFGYTFVSSQPGLVCRIDGKPASQSCAHSPPSDAYWAYYHASRGGHWTYSTAGAGNRTPPPGSVEGWAFGDSATPSVAPPPPPATTTTRAEAPPTTAVSPTVTIGDGPTSTTSGASGAAPTTSSAPDATTTSSVTGEKRLSSAAGSPGQNPGSDGELAASRASDGGGGSLGPVLGGCAIAAVAGLGLWQARRRSRAEQDLA
jgi:hypothetical protein